MSAALVSPETTRQRAEAALIFQHTRPVNNQFTKVFTEFDTTTIKVSGEKAAKLTTTFTVKKDAKRLALASESFSQTRVFKGRAPTTSSAPAHDQRAISQTILASCSR